MTIARRQFDNLSVTENILERAIRGRQSTFQVCICTYVS